MKKAKIWLLKKLGYYVESRIGSPISWDENKTDTFYRLRNKFGTASFWSTDESVIWDYPKITLKLLYLCLRDRYK